MCDNSEVAKNLARWAVEEMGFREGGVTAETLDLSGICLGPMSDVWMYVMKHVKSEATVQMIKGNLKLHDREQANEPEMQALIKKRDKLRQEVAELERTTKVLHDSLIETQDSVLEKEKTLRKHKAEFRDLKRSSHLLSLAKKNTEEQSNTLKKSTQELEKQMKNLSPTLSKEADLERYRIDIENMGKLMQNSLNELLNEEPNIDKINATKFTIGNNLASLLQAVPRPVFMKLIEEHQASEISAMKEKLQAFSLREDNIPEFIPENFQPLQKLLYELSWFYADTRARAKKTMNDAAALKVELTELKSQIINRLGCLFKDDPEKLANEQKIFELEIQVAQRKGAAEALRSELANLDEFCLQHEARQLEIEQKIATIERNSRLSDQLTALTCTLARKRADSSKHVQELVNQSQKLVNDEILPMLSKLDENIERSKHNFQKELDIYKELKPSQLFTVRLQNKISPVNHLAMNRLLMASDSSVSGKHLEKIVRQLGLPRTLSGLRVIQAVGEKRLQTQKMQQILNWHATREAEILEKHGSTWLSNGSIRCKELAKELEDCWHSQEAKILPSLELRRKRMEESAKLIEEVELAFKEWCDEPAKLINTGRVVNGQTLEQWRALWRKSLTSSRK